MRHIEKKKHLLAKLGEFLRAQRLTVFNESLQEFAARLIMFGANDATADMIQAMEQGDEAIDIGTWICAWQVMQVSDAVVKASKSDAVLYLAAAKLPLGIEEEMAATLNKKKGSE